MSTNDNWSDEDPVESTDDDLDLFSAELFGQSKAPTEEATSEETETDEVEETPSEKDTHSEDDDALADEDEEEEQEEPAPKPKKNRFQERIDEVVGKQKDAERQLAAALAEIEKLRQDTAPKPTPKAEETGEPNPDDKREDGSDKYPLGEFDPQYIKDLTKFSLAQERASEEERRKAEEEQHQMDAARADLQRSWNEKLDPAQERYPDFQEKGQQLVDSLSDLDQDYGEYLTSVLMSMDHGPDVLYYLANNPDEARKIVNSGPQRATLALGRIESKFLMAEEEKQKARPKVSKAPAPPAHLNKGSSAARASVAPDTDDLDAFTKEFFKR